MPSPKTVAARTHNALLTFKFSLGEDKTHKKIFRRLICIFWLRSDTDLQKA